MYQRCRAGWTRYGRHCYMFREDRKNWQDALDSCRQLGGDLAAVNSPEEQEFVESQLAIGKCN